MKNDSNQKSVSQIIIEKQSANASVAICQLNNTMSLDAISITEAIEEQEELLAKGDLTSLENMLLSQTHVLNSIFTQMVSKMGNTEYINKLEFYSRIALKAQNQTRQTIATLAEVKGIKKTTFIHQVNQAHNQQVNNGAEKNLNNSSNEKVDNHVDRRSKRKRTEQNKQNKTLALQDTRGQQTFSNELIQTRHEICQNEGVREAVSPTKQDEKRSKEAS